MADENTTLVSMSLTSESARDVRIERVVQAQPNIPAKIKMLAFYDYMIYKKSRLHEQTNISQVSYQQGWNRGIAIRNYTKDTPWFETEIKKVGSKWVWVLFKEGYFVCTGSCSSQIKAEHESFSRRFDYF